MDQRSPSSRGHCTPVSVSSLMLYSFGMIALPVAAFFSTQTVAEFMMVNDSNLYGAVAAVMAVSVILFMLIIKSLTEDTGARKQRIFKKD